MATAMGKGINLGATFEMDMNSRSADRIHALFSSYKAKGFHSVRIPVTWSVNAQGWSRLRDATFMAQLDDAIRYAVSIGLIVLINTHHEHWLYSSYTGTSEQNGVFWTLWKDIATRYKDIPQNKLVFQILNEPQGRFGAYKDGTDPQSKACKDLTKLINRTGYDGVRFVDKTRVVAFMPTNMGNCFQVPACYPTASDLPMPGDKYLMMTFHSYDPFTWCGQDGSDHQYASQAHPYTALRADIDKRTKMIADWKHKMPAELGAVMTEFGIGRRNTPDLNNALIREHLRYTAASMANAGCGVMLWVDNGWFKVMQEPTYIYGLADAMLGH